MSADPNSGYKRVSVLLFMLVSVWWGLETSSPPAPKPADSPDTEFSSERAFKHVVAMSGAPHMAGTPENDSVRSYIVSQLERLGLEPEIREGTGIVNARTYRAVRTKNIFARIEGSNPEQTLMLMAHYDSVPHAPGAADDAAGVAAILEVVRIIQTERPPQNDILILITDGEELGLMGARHFAATYEGLNEIDLILNVEARGTSGASIMFETNTGNSKLIPLFAAASRNPVANSLTYTVYNILPNDTDFSIFKDLGVQGLNYGFIEDYLNYHTRQDNPENLSLSSLQHHGENLLDDVRYFGYHYFDLNSNSNLVYFNNPVGGLTFYPQSWSFWLTGITVLLFLLILFIAFLNRWISLSKSLIGLLSYLGCLTVGLLVTWFGWRLINQFFPEYQWLQHGETYARTWYLWLFILFVALLVIPGLRWATARINSNNQLTGIYLVWVSLLITLTILLPATSYFLLWPAFFALIGWLFTLDDIKSGEYGWKTLGILCISLFMVLFMFPFYIKLIHVALTTQMLSASILPVLLMMGLLWPLLNYLVSAKPRLTYTLLFLSSVVCLAGASVSSGYDENQKKQNSLIYAADLDNHTYHWLSTDHTTDGWTSQFLGDAPSDSGFSSYKMLRANGVLFADAPALPFEAPRITYQDTSKSDSVRRVSLSIQSPDNANGMVLSLVNTPPVLEAVLDGKILYNRSQLTEGQPDSLTHITYYRNMENPFRLDLVLKKDTSRLVIQTVSFDTVLPDSLMQTYSERDPSMMPKPFGFTNGTLWKKTFYIDNLQVPASQDR